MAKKGALFNLVKSLSKSEKRYFRLNLSGDESKNYSEVFDFIDTQEEMDDKAIADAFKERSFGKQLHVTKNYLTKQILKSLRNFHSGGSKRAQLYDWLREVEILYKKELYDQCGDIIKRARGIAEQYEKLTELLEVLSWERRLIVAQKGFKAIDQINGIIAYESQVIEKLNNVNQYIALTYNLFGSAPPEVAIQELNNNPLVTDKSNALSFSALTFYYHIQYICNTFGGDAEVGLQQISELIEAFEERSHLIRENPDSYVTALNNKMGALLHMKRPKEEALELLYKIREVPEKYKLKQDNYTIKIFLKTYNVELELYRDMKNWGEGKRLIGEIQSFLDNNLRFISDGYLISFYYQFAYIHFKSGEFSKSLKNLNEIINSLQSDERLDIQAYARFLLLIIHYELGNIIVLRYAVDATRRFLKKSRKLHDFETKLLKFFSKLSTSPAFNHKELFTRLRGSLFEGVEENQKAHIQDYLDFEDWLEGRVK